MLKPNVGQKVYVADKFGYSYSAIVVALHEKYAVCKSTSDLFRNMNRGIPYERIFESGNEAIAYLDEKIKREIEQYKAQSNTPENALQFIFRECGKGNLEADFVGIDRIKEFFGVNIR